MPLAEGWARCGGEPKFIASIEELPVIAHRERAAPAQPRVELPLGARPRGLGLSAFRSYLSGFPVAKS